MIAARARGEFETVSTLGCGHELGHAWTELSEDERLPYKAKQIVDKARYDNEMLSYVPPKTNASTAAVQSASAKGTDRKRLVKPTKPHAADVCICSRTSAPYNCSWTVLG